MQWPRSNHLITVGVKFRAVWKFAGIKSIFTLKKLLSSVSGKI